MLKTIKLYGVLGKKFGKEFHLAVESTREAVKALSVQVPGFEQFMLTAHEQGLTLLFFKMMKISVRIKSTLRLVPKLSRSSLKLLGRVVMEYCKRFLVR